MHDSSRRAVRSVHRPCKSMMSLACRIGLWEQTRDLPLPCPWQPEVVCCFHWEAGFRGSQPSRPVDFGSRRLPSPPLKASGQEPSPHPAAVSGEDAELLSVRDRTIAPPSTSLGTEALGLRRRQKTTKWKLGQAEDHQHCASCTRSNSASMRLGCLWACGLGSAWEANATRGAQLWSLPCGRNTAQRALRRSVSLVRRKEPQPPRKATEAGNVQLGEEPVKGRGRHRGVLAGGVLPAEAPALRARPPSRSAGGSRGQTRERRLQPVRDSRHNAKRVYSEASKHNGTYSCSHSTILGGGICS